MNLELKEGHELRFEVCETPVKIKVFSGYCEIKGDELLVNKIYEFQTTKTFIYAHTDCKLLIDGKFTAHYVTDNSNIPQILRFMRLCMKHEKEANFKFSGENIKQIFSKNKFIVLGQGKSTFIQTISNYLITLGKSVLITELSPKTGYLLFPGCISTCLCKNIRSCTDDSFTDDPLVYFYGSTSLKYNREYYERILSNLNDLICEIQFDFHFILANEEILESINKFEAFKNGCYVALKDEKLYSMLEGEKIFISNGAYEKKTYTNQYFNTKANTYNIKLWSKVIRIGEEFLAPESALPIGAERKIDSNVVTPVIPIKNKILGATFAENEEDIMDSPIKSFVVVSEVGEDFLKVQSLQPGLKPSFLIQGEIELE